MTCITRNTTCVSLAILLFPAACLLANDGTPPSSSGFEAAPKLESGEAYVNRELAALRRVTAHLHRFENAAPAGWNIPVTECMENPPVGGMGYHFGNEDFYLDGVANLLEPEVLLYEPRRNGKLRLVAVEYVVPLFTWQGEGSPMLFGREMNWNPDTEEWTLHAWIWKYNPAGIFEDWNPNVSCEFAG